MSRHLDRLWFDLCFDRVGGSCLCQITNSAFAFHCQSCSIDRDLNLSNRLSILKRTHQANHFLTKLNGDLLSLVHGSLWLRVDKSCLLALKLRARGLLVLTCLRLVVLECSLVKVTIREVESSLDHVVFEHESIVV